MVAVRWLGVRGGRAVTANTWRELHREFDFDMPPTMIVDTAQVMMRLHDLTGGRTEFTQSDVATITAMAHCRLVGWRQQGILRPVAGRRKPSVTGTTVRRLYSFHDLFVAAIVCDLYRAGVRQVKSLLAVSDALYAGFGVAESVSACEVAT